MGETRLQREARRRAEATRRAIGLALRELRVDAGLTIAAVAVAVAVAAAAGLDPAFVGRVERGERAAGLEVLTAISGVLGADLSVRAHPNAGPRIRDRFQAPMIEAFVRDLHERWVPDPEVIVRRPVHAAIDLLLTDRRDPVVVGSEFQSELRRLEQQVRWHREKELALPSADVWPLISAEGAPATSRLLVLRLTTDTRELANRFATTLQAAYPARTADALAAPTPADAPWPGAAIAWMRVQGGRAEVVDGVPRGVHVGR